MEPKRDETDVITHGTCTSTRLDQTTGSKPEHINMDVLNQLYFEKTGTKISDDPAIARIQREQTIVWDKRRKQKNG